MRHSQRARRFSRGAPLLILACALGAAHPRSAQAQVTPGGFVSAISDIVSVTQKVYAGLNWLACYSGSVCPESDAHVQADRVISALSSLVTNLDKNHMMGRLQSLMDEADVDYRNPQKLSVTEEQNLFNTADSVFNDFKAVLDGANPQDASQVEMAYELTPGFVLLAATVDAIGQTSLARGVIPVDMTWITSKRQGTLETFDRLVGVREAWYLCPATTDPVTMSTVQSFEGTFPLKILWKHFADAGFSHDSCGNTCNIFNHFKSPSSAICQNTCSTSIGGISIPICTACVVPTDVVVYQDQLPGIIGKVDQDPVVQAIRGSVTELVALGVNIVPDTYCGNKGSLTVGANVMNLAVGTNSDGRLELFYSKSDGAVYHDAEATPNGDWAGESSLGGFGNQIAVGQNLAGNLEIFYPMSDVISHNYQSGGGWAGDGPLKARATKVAAARDSVGRQVVFYMPSDGGLTWFRQNGANGAGGWGSYRPYLFQSTVKDFVVGQNKDGRLEVFFIAGDDNIYHTWQTAAGSDSWSSYAFLAGTAKRLAVAPNTDGRLEVVYLGLDGSVSHIAQTLPNLTWSAATGLGGAGKELAMAQNRDGRLEIFYSGLSDTIYHNAQSSPGGSWGSESQLGGSAKKLAVGRNADGRLELFYLQMWPGLGGTLLHNRQLSAGSSSWSGELAMPVTNPSTAPLGIGSMPAASTAVNPAGGPASGVSYVRGDFNGDGLSDLVVTTANGSSWYYATTSGTWNESYIRSDLRLGGVKFTPGDFNGDGKTDLIITTPSGSYWYYATGTGTWNGAYTRPDLTLGTVNFTTGDFNGDKKTDVVISTHFGSFWYYSTGTGTWNQGYSRGDLPLGSVAYTPGDFNGDGKTDLVITTGSGSYWYYSTGIGTWNEAYVRGDLPLGTVGYTPGDFNGDGKTDLVIATGAASYWYYSTGTGSWSTPYARADLPLNGVTYTPGDFNGDGKADLVITTGSGSYWYYSTGTGTWNAPYARADLPRGAVAYTPGDFNGDKKTDLVITTGSGSYWYYSTGTGTWNTSYQRSDLLLAH